MIRPLALPTLTAIGCLCLSAFGSSCSSTNLDEDQSEHTKKVRESKLHSEIMRRQRRRHR